MIRLMREPERLTSNLNIRARDAFRAVAKVATCMSVPVRNLHARDTNNEGE